MPLKISAPPTSLRELCLEKMKEAIISGYLPSGQRLVERTLCDQLGVSRSVVREVIRYLEAEGLVEVIPNKGPIVATLNWEQAAEIYEIRLLLEQRAVAGCINKLTEQSKKDLKLALEELKLAFTQEDIQKILKQSTEVYRIIFFTAGQEVGWEIVQRLNSRISRLRAMTMNYKKREVTGYERVKMICEAIYLHQDVQKARAAVHDHIKEAAGIAHHILKQKTNLFEKE